MQPRDLLDHVLLDLEVETVRRRGDREFIARARERQLQALDQHRDLFSREPPSEVFAPAAGARRTGLARRRGRTLFVYGPRRTAADVEYQLRGALDCLRGCGKIHAALEAESRVAGQREPSSAARDGGGIEPRRLEKHLGGRIGNRT